MQITRAIVPAAGRGTRLYPITRAQPKEMLPLGTRPVIQGVAEELIGAGVTDILLITGEGKRAIEDHFDPAGGLTPENAPAENRRFALDPTSARFYALRQGEPRGLGHAVGCGAEFAGDEHVVVALGDCILTSGEPVRRLVTLHERHGADISIVVQRVSLEATGRYGIIDPGDDLDDDSFEMRGIVEKPGPDAAPSRYAVAARYVFSPEIFDYLRGLKPGLGDEIQLTDAIGAMIADGHRAVAVPLAQGEHRLDVGNFGSYGRAFIRTMLTDSALGKGMRTYTANLLTYLDDPANPDPDLPKDS
ncbi:MAG: UTP--glucose-1-phosphate uridylyltransferase [Armatimonadota bacterium]